MAEDSPKHRTPLVSLHTLPDVPRLRLAVVGHVEVVTFLRVAEVPSAGAICQAKEGMELPAGGGPVVAVQMAKLTGRPVAFFTALGRDRAGEQAAMDLEALGLELHVAWREAPTRRGVSWVDDRGERTITVLGERLMPCASDALPWSQLKEADGVFVTATDVGGLQLARACPVLAATPRVRWPVLLASGVTLDALVGSAFDPAEALPQDGTKPPSRCIIATEAGAGSTALPGGLFGPPPLDGPLVDAYGAGDSFAAGLTAALASGWSLAEAISLGSHCGAACLRGFGPYARQLERADLKRPASADNP
ncbi:MAG: PfkB family carbohydrate kinase [Cyanobacteriota bacterium]|nr:PfkB family carbohydrate kinase [Cyanobacteriota bacterium]